MAETHKELIREILNQGAINLSEEQIVKQGNHEIRIIPLGEGSTRFDLPQLKKTYVLMSGRLYERPFMGSTSAESKPAPKAEAPETHFATQPGYAGENEKVDTRIYRNRITCTCGNPRWVKNSDLFQVKLCKPCTLKGRQERRKAKQ